MAISRQERQSKAQQAASLAELAANGVQGAAEASRSIIEDLRKDRRLSLQEGNYDRLGQTPS